MTSSGHRHKRRHDDTDDSDDSKGKRTRPSSQIERESHALAHPAFEVWLYDEKRKRLEDLNREDKGHYARKFRGRWNSGKLPARYCTNSPASSAIDKRYDETSQNREGSSSALERLQLQRNADLEARERERSELAWKRKQERREEQREEKDSRSVGKERLLEKRMDTRSANREFARRKDDTEIEFSSSALGLDDDSSFAAALAARERAKARPTAKQLRYACF